MPSALHIHELPEPDEPFEVVIDDYGFTAEGFVRLADGWLSIQGAMPGERVRARMERAQRGGRRRFATLIEVLEAHPQRRDPGCRWDEVCRGCQLRHVTLHEEVALKERALKEVLERFSGWPLEALPPIELIAPGAMARSDGWRARSSLSYRRFERGYELGLSSPKRQQLVPMGTCPALTMPAQRLIQQLGEALDGMARDGTLPEGSAQPGGLQGIRIAAPVHGRGFIELTQQQDSEELSPRLFELAERLDGQLAEHISVTVQWGSAPQRYERLRGPSTMRLALAGLLLELDPRDWFHATLEPAEALYEYVERSLCWQPGERLLDVGSGIGTLSLMAARAGLEAVGVDARLSSIESARRNAERLGFGARARFVPGSWESALRRLVMAGERFDVITINPMREPLGERALSYINALKPERLLYLGPSPASASRDLSVLRQSGWHLEALAGAMLHPATYHVMLVARLRIPMCSRDLADCTASG